MKVVRVAHEGPVGRVVLDRPAKLNALSPEVLAGLVEAAGALDAIPAVKAVVVSGEGRAFCAGFDLGAFGGAAGDDPRETADLGRRMAEAIAGMRAVTVAAVQGHCVGGGVVLAAACDLRVAARDAVFSIPELDLGIPLAWGGIPRLVRELGPAVTKELVMTCRPFGAEEARALRFVNRVVEPDALGREAEALATDLARRSAFTLEATKQAVEDAAEQLVSTAGAAGDADLLVEALGDEESGEVRTRYAAGRATRSPRRR